MRTPAHGPLIRLQPRRFPQIRLLASTAIFAASTVSMHAQTQVTNWGGQFSSDWFFGDNWINGAPRRTFDVNINTATPNSTEIGRSGAEANNLAVGQNGTGMLTIKTGGTLLDRNRGDRQSTGRGGHGVGDRPRLQLDEYQRRGGRRPGHGHSYSSRRGHSE